MQEKNLVMIFSHCLGLKYREIFLTENLLDLLVEH